MSSVSSKRRESVRRWWANHGTAAVRVCSRCRHPRVTKGGRLGPRTKFVCSDCLTFACIDCSINTVEAGEYYMVQDEVWSQSGMGFGGAAGMLCIGCLELRIGRYLISSDFTTVLVNKLNATDEEREMLGRLAKKSERLASRLLIPAGARSVAAAATELNSKSTRFAQRATLRGSDVPDQLPNR